MSIFTTTTLQIATSYDRVEIVCEDDDDAWQCPIIAATAATWFIISSFLFLISLGNLIAIIVIILILPKSYLTVLTVCRMLC